MKPRISSIVLAALAGAALAGACSQALGLKDPTISAAGDGLDAAVDGASPGAADAAVDTGSVGVVDAGLDASVDAAVDSAPPGCVPSACPFGCDADSPTQACRPAKLWVYPTTGLYVGDGFGGQDNTVRATSDALCIGTSESKFAARACSRNRTHAVLFISQGDSIPLMTVKYSIPTDAPVHRADDDVRVFASWNDLIDTTNTKPPAVPVTTAASGAVWSGALGSATCQAWASSVPAELGNQGDTSVTSANWLSRRGAVACDQLAKLLCICWSGGE